MRYGEESQRMRGGGREEARLGVGHTPRKAGIVSDSEGWPPPVHVICLGIQQLLWLCAPKAKDFCLAVTLQIVMKRTIRFWSGGWRQRMAALKAQEEGEEEGMAPTMDMEGEPASGSGTQPSDSAQVRKRPKATSKKLKGKGAGKSRKGRPRKWENPVPEVARVMHQRSRLKFLKNKVSGKDLLEDPLTRRTTQHQHRPPVREVPELITVVLPWSMFSSHSLSVSISLCLSLSVPTLPGSVLQGPSPFFFFFDIHTPPPPPTKTSSPCMQDTLAAWTTGGDVGDLMEVVKGALAGNSL